MEPSASLRFVKLRLYFDTKLCMAETSERAATPTKVTSGLAAATLLTFGASALQNGHHGVQNHNTAGLPTRLDPENGAPDRVVPANCSRSSATALGGLTRANASRPVSAANTTDRLILKKRCLIPISSRSPTDGQLVVPGHTLLNTRHRRLRFSSGEGGVRPRIGR